MPELNAYDEWLSAQQAADLLGVSARRVLALIGDGALVARQDGRRWRVARASVAQRMRQQARPVRPLSASSSELLKDALEAKSGGQPSPRWHQAMSRDRARAKDRAERLSGEAAPAALLRAWLHDGPPPQPIDLPLSMLDSLEAEPSGISYPAAEIDASGEVELVVAQPIREQQSAKGPRVNAIVHVRPGPVRRVDAIIDLAMHARPREDEAVKRLLHSHQ